MDLSVVVPCFNEAENAGKLVAEFRPVMETLARTRTTEVVFVDDGSRDDTWSALHDAFRGPLPFGVRFERHEVNRGLGAAIRTGLRASRGEVVVTTDCDGTYRFTDIPLLLERLAPDVDIVTASPYHPEGGVAGVPAYRLALSQGSSLLYRLLVDWHIHTYTSLLRAYRRRVVDTVPFEADGFLAGTEILVNGMLLGFRAAELPTVLHARAFGVSKAKIARTIRAHLGFQARVLLHRLGVRRLVPAPARAAAAAAAGGMAPAGGRRAREGQ
jgi:dolichol-phosphate mannosyltransferase